MGIGSAAASLPMDESRRSIPSLAGALAALATPGVAERCSPLTGAGAFVVDLRRDDGAGGDRAALTLACERLRSLPCPTVGVGPLDASSPRVAALAATLDVLVTTPAQWAVIDEAIRAAPIAAMTLAQVLRAGAGLAVDDALLLESLAYGNLLVGAEHGRWLAERPRAALRSVGAEPALLVTRTESRLDLVFNRPEKRNAYSASTRDALVAALDIVVADPSITEVVLAGRGESFCAGGDLDEFGTHPDLATAHAIRSTRSAARMLASCADRVRVEVRGACIGAGIELAAFARRVVAARSAFFQLPELAMGLIPGAGGTASIPRRIGPARAAWMALSGARIDAPTALAWGLIDEIVD